MTNNGKVKVTMECFIIRSLKKSGNNTSHSDLELLRNLLDIHMN